MEHHVSVWPVLLLALIHFFGTQFSFISGVPRSIWLSMAGGVSVSYVFLHLFPELNEGQEHIINETEGMTYLKHHVYIVALGGLALFYGLERLAVSSRSQQNIESGEDQPSSGMFWIHIVSFAIYNALIGYLLFTREEGPVKQLILFSIAMALHFVINDYGLLEHHKNRYARIGRWILVGALLIGWATGYMVELSDTLVVVVLAFVGGGVILNVLKEELPEQRKSRYWAFIVGATAYSLLLLAL